MVFRMLRYNTGDHLFHGLQRKLLAVFFPGIEKHLAKLVAVGTEHGMFTVVGKRSLRYRSWRWIGSVVAQEELQREYWFFRHNRSRAKVKTK